MSDLLQMQDTELFASVDRIKRVVLDGQAFRDKFNEVFPLDRDDIWARRNTNLDCYLTDVIDETITKVMREEFTNYIRRKE